MSILIQAGHCSSYSDVIMQKLYKRGLGQPADSYTHHMTAQQVADKLYKIISRKNVSVTNNKLADNVMVDLLLSNLDTQNWGWSAEKNLFAMDLWQQLESEVKFILVFDHPSYLLGELISADITVGTIDQVISVWVEYHQKMLETLEAHEDKAILIEGSCAVDNISNLGKQVESISSDLHLKKHWQVFKDATDPTSNNDTDAVNQSSPAIDHINNEILKKFPEVIKLFNTLLSKAAIKSSEPIYRTKQANLTELVTVLNNLHDKRKNTQHLVEKELPVEQLHHVQEQLENQLSVHEEYKQQKIKEYGLLEKKLEEAVLAQQEAEKRATAHQKSIDNYKSRIEQLSRDSRNSANSIDAHNSAESLKQENEMLLKQLHHTQEELEKYYLKSQSLAPAKEVVQSQATIQPPFKAPVYYGAADRVKNDLPYRLGSKVVKAKKPKDLALLPLTLAKEYSDFQKNGGFKYPTPEIEDSRDIQEMEKVKKHLSYQIGQALVESFKSPRKMLFAPLSIGKKIIIFNK